MTIRFNGHFLEHSSATDELKYDSGRQDRLAQGAALAAVSPTHSPTRRLRFCESRRAPTLRAPQTNPIRY